ncbi:MAG: hypothetical protein QNJ72_41245 [Pleurocapsa sp. MO_226.B13]|nr:hypothetical protein [Pleurocapsa sp. MO_226.B13]
MSRKFLYQQQQKGNQALEQEFNPPQEESDILYWIPLKNYLHRRAQGAKSQREKLEEKMRKAKKKGQGNRWSKKLTVARLAEQKAQQLVQDIAILLDWLVMPIFWR